MASKHSKKSAPVHTVKTVASKETEVAKSAVVTAVTIVIALMNVTYSSQL